MSFKKVPKILLNNVVLVLLGISHLLMPLYWIRVFSSFSTRFSSFWITLCFARVFVLFGHFLSQLVSFCPSFWLFYPISVPWLFDIFLFSYCFYHFHTTFYPLQSLWIMFICFGDIFHFFIQMLCTIRPSRKSCDIVRNFAEWWRSSWKVNCAARKNGMQEPRSSFKTLFSRTMAIPNWFSYILMSFLETPFVPLINGFHKNLTRIMHKNLLSKIFQWFFYFWHAKESAIF